MNEPTSAEIFFITDDVICVVKEIPLISWHCFYGYFQTVFLTMSWKQKKLVKLLLMWNEV